MFGNIRFLVPTQSRHLELASSRLVSGRETFGNSRVLPKRKLIFGALHYFPDWYRLVN